MNNNDVCGVYYILNSLNKKLYIGSSLHINKRFYEHKYFLNKNIHKNKHLQNTWKKYGEDNFEFGIIEEVKDSIEKIREAEQCWMDYFKSYNANNGYNISHYAEGSGGYTVSDETKEKLRIWHIGRKASNETKVKLSEQRQGELNNFYGKHHTDETKIKLSEMKIGVKLTEKQLENLALGRGNKYHTEETYIKLSNANRGEGSPTAKLREDEVIELLKMLKKGVLYKDISSIYKISLTQISRIKHKERWGYLYEKMPELYS